MGVKAIKKIKAYLLSHYVATAIMLVILAILVGTTYLIISHNQQSRASVASEIGNNTSSKIQLLTPTDTDLIYGPRKASMYLIMYSDADCQYCRSLYPKLKNVVDSYPEGTVSLVYRHLPLYHSRGEVDDTERAGYCVARDYGDQGFFKFQDALFASLPVGIQTDGTSRELLKESASVVGMSEEDLFECIDSGYADTYVTTSHRSGGALGIVAIPHTFLLSEFGSYPILKDLDESVFSVSVDYVLDLRNANER